MLPDGTYDINEIRICRTSTTKEQQSVNYNEEINLFGQRIKESKNVRVELKKGCPMFDRERFAA